VPWHAFCALSENDARHSGGEGRGKEEGKPMRYCLFLMLILWLVVTYVLGWDLDLLT
jgi:hypothetical protein